MVKGAVGLTPGRPGLYDLYFIRVDLDISMSGSTGPAGGTGVRYLVPEKVCFWVKNVCFWGKEKVFLLKPRKTVFLKKKTCFLEEKKRCVSGENT